MPRSDPLLAAAGLLRPRVPRILAAVALGVLSLGSALGLAGVSAWLITRAWQMPPVLDLSVAVVAVRTFAISRGVLHYCERLATHDSALRAAGTARAQIYHRLARGPAASALRLHSGELVARVGADVDELANVLVRAVVPIAVAAVLGLAATAVVAAISPPAAAVLAICLLLAGFVAPRLAGRAAATQEEVARQYHSDRDTSAMIALEHAPELRVAGALPDVIADSRRRQRAWADALDAAARPAAIAEAMPTAAIGASVLGAVVAGIGLAHAVAPTTLAVLM
ncbi:MAG TPA: ABC transporter ATP-binding protein, partial [Mycobacterium sp.]|nr:ABC transporter ATP-binding protein [Mycobacterium sp.]